MKYIALNDRLYRYLLAQRSGWDDPLLKALAEETGRLGEASRMQISPEQGTFLTLLVAAIGARRALEIGTFTGYSAICIARGLGTRGELICLDQSEQWTAIARKYWKRAGVKIRLRLGPALQSLAGLRGSPKFDFVFIDADKTEYDAYYERVLPKVKTNGLIVFDNMLWGGRLARSRRLQSVAIDKLNRKLARDRRVQAVLLPIADGLQICRKI